MGNLEREDSDYGWTYIPIEPDQHLCNLPIDHGRDIPGEYIRQIQYSPEPVGTLWLCKECGKLWQTTPKCEFCWITNRPGNRVPEYSEAAHMHVEGEDWRAAFRWQIRKVRKADRQRRREQRRQDRRNGFRGADPDRFDNNFTPDFNPPPASLGPIAVRESRLKNPNPPSVNLNPAAHLPQPRESSDVQVDFKD